MECCQRACCVKVVNLSVHVLQTLMSFSKCEHGTFKRSCYAQTVYQSVYVAKARGVCMQLPIKLCAIYVHCQSKWVQAILQAFVLYLSWQWQLKTWSVKHGMLQVLNMLCTSYNQNVYTELYWHSWLVMHWSCHDNQSVYEMPTVL